MDEDQMRDFLGVDSLKFISLDGLYRAVGEAKRNAENPQYCDACFSGEYPTELTDLNEREAHDLLTLPVNRVA